MISLGLLSCGGILSDGAQRLPPGPLELPGVGSLGFLFKAGVTRKPIAQLMLQYRHEYGPLYTFVTGPMRHVWASGAIADELLATYASSGRPGRVDHPLANDDFLFNIIDPLEAAPIRKTQHEWLSQNVDQSRVAAALLEVEPALTAAIATNLDADARAHWPKEQLGRALLGAMLRVFAGAPSANLSEDELSRLQAALHGFRLAPRGSPKMEQPDAESSGATRSGLFGAPNEDFVGEVRRLLLLSLHRSEKPPSELPLLVSAAVGGGEIFPLIFEWIVRRLALEPKLQEELRTQCRGGRVLVRSKDGGGGLRGDAPAPLRCGDRPASQADRRPPAPGRHLLVAARRRIHPQRLDALCHASGARARRILEREWDAAADPNRRAHVDAHRAC